MFKTQFKMSNTEIVKTVRLGRKRDDNKPRVLLVTLSDFGDKRYVLRNARNLRQSDEWSDVFISPDLTPQEREAGRNLRAELKQRRDQGETNLIIQFG